MKLPSDYSEGTRDFAAFAYAAYTANSGGLNYQGLPCPKWEELPEAIQGHWCSAVVELAGRFFVLPDFALPREFRQARAHDPLTCACCQHAIKEYERLDDTHRAELEKLAAEGSTYRRAWRLLYLLLTVEARRQRFYADACYRAGYETWDRYEGGSEALEPLAKIAEALAAGVVRDPLSELLADWDDTAAAFRHKLDTAPEGLVKREEREELEKYLDDAT